MAKTGKHFDFPPGVLNEIQISTLFENGKIKPKPGGDIGWSSFDLHLGEEYWEMDGSIKPLSGEHNIKRVLDYGTKKTSSDAVTLERGKTYIFKLREYLNFKDKEFYGRATGRSSIGRVDVLTRLITEGCCKYDQVDQGYTGDLYLEVTPITFPVIVQAGTPMNQLRLFVGPPEISELHERGHFYLQDHIFDEYGNPIEDKKKFDELTLNLKPVGIGGARKKAVAFCAKTAGGEEEPEAIDLTRTYVPKDDTNKYDPEVYWTVKEAVKRKGEYSLEIDKEEFHILRSKERFSLPDDIAVYCRAITEELGEIRIHYAGFVHPAFGSSTNGNDERINGAPLAFEVRGHNVKAILRDGETLARLKYFRMSEVGKPEDSADYGDQELKLSKFFKDWQE